MNLEFIEAIDALAKEKQLKIGIDELTQLEKFKYIYMRSRVRKTKDNKLPTQLMASSNPGKRGNKWVRERFIEKIDTDIQDKSQFALLAPAIWITFILTETTMKNILWDWIG